ncbi:hypothetical protein BBK82_32110 [Lentzea guizhouensis]|uniref:DUF305 domain-containing protein n=1 Tax=Lentzea guizhouensis TaxID=1586287 RepID=A0A1B2HQM6_9PSEU|nr:DUF305 domain-containing protein [Lentzea guizhouensis]ANZ40001.1 hypothetical protein BBK82_32110 [Lentzea guizhouensis]
MKKSLIGAVLGMLFIAACSSTNTNNAADVTFARGMVPHHEQALEMARLVPDRSSDDQVRRLAQRIEEAQDPEITQMTAWLEKWGEKPGAHAGHDMAGMMSQDDMTKLEKASGAEFDKMWLEMMVEHHEGAVEMARTELEDGRDPEAKKLAQAIIDGQQQEIAEMKDLLKTR